MKDSVESIIALWPVAKEFLVICAICIYAAVADKIHVTWGGGATA